MSDVQLHSNPLLRASFELRCPDCGAEADYFQPVYEQRDYVAMYPCECRMKDPYVTYALKLEAQRRVFASRCAVWSRLPADYRAMATRAYEVTPENQEGVARLAAIGPRDRVYLHGMGGVGKTHLGITTAVELFSQGLTVEYWSELSFFEQARKFAVSDSDTKVKPGRAGDVLILDDLGKTRATPYAAEMLYDVLEFRSANNLGMIITSNHPPDETAQNMVLDARNANAVESRLRSGVVIELLGRDRRAGDE